VEAAAAPGASPNGTAARQVYLASLNVAYVEEYEAASAEPFVETVG
jgi:hypothetical protein